MMKINKKVSGVFKGGKSYWRGLFSKGRYEKSLGNPDLGNKYMIFSMSIPLPLLFFTNDF